MIQLEEFQQSVGLWSCHNFGDQDPVNPLLGVGEEVGELYHAHLKMRQGIRGTRAEHLDGIADAIGDTVIYLADYCERMGLSLGLCIEKAWDQVKYRDWKKYPETGFPSPLTKMTGYKEVE